ncbi:MAG TPA: hypothetical protein VIK59_07400 [Verrucomicrobiae bacterium]
MSNYICPKCGKLEEHQVYEKYFNSKSSGPFVAGHLGGNPNLPLVGMQPYSQYLAPCCLACGIEVSRIFTEEDRRQWQQDCDDRQKLINRFWMIVGILVGIGILIWIISDIQQ